MDVFSYNNVTIQQGKFKGLVDTRIIKCNKKVELHPNRQPCKLCQYIPIRSLPLRRETLSVTVDDVEPLGTSPHRSSQSKIYNQNININHQLGQLLKDIIDDFLESKGLDLKNREFDSNSGNNLTYPIYEPTRTVLIREFAKKDM